MKLMCSMSNDCSGQAKLMAIQYFHVCCWAGAGEIDPFPAAGNTAPKTMNRKNSLIFKFIGAQTGSANGDQGQ